MAGSAGPLKVPAGPGGGTERTLWPDVPELFLDGRLIDTASGLEAVAHAAEPVAASADAGGQPVHDAVACRPAGPVAIRADDRDRLGTEIVTATAGRYAAASVALLAVIDTACGRIEAQWATSTDGRTWRRPFRRPLFAIDGYTRIEDALHDAATLPYPRADRGSILFFCRPAHGRRPGPRAYRLRRDGWLSLDAGSHRGTVVTRPMRWPGTAASGGDPWLAVNARVRRGGTMVVRVLDEHGAAWPGLSRRGIDGSDRVQADSPVLPVTWNGRRGTGHLDLAGKVVRLRFDLTHASLFSFCVYRRRQ